MENYKKTPLVQLPNLAKHLGLKNILIKDESKRFGLNAFKCLGAFYSVNELKKAGELKDGDTVTTMTDGNHGRAVAYAARKLNLKCVIYVPFNMVKARIENLKKENAEVI